MQLIILLSTLVSLIVFSIIWRFWPRRTHAPADEPEHLTTRNEKATDEIRVVDVRDMRVADIERVLQRAADDVFKPTQ